MDDEKQPQISTVAAYALVAVSIFFDLIELLFDFIPVVGWIANIFVDIFAGLTFYLWFKILGISFIRGRRIMSFASGFILGAIPFTSWFAWTVDVLLIIADVRGEELLGKMAPGAAEKLQKVSSGVKKNVYGRIPRGPL